MSRTKAQNRVRSHLKSWVMLSPASTPPYTPLPSEQNLFTSPPRIALSVSTPTHYPGKQQQPYSLSSSAGVLYLTNRRLIYLPDKPTDKFQSFAAPITHLHDSHVTAPFFGPNVWLALMQPVQGGGIPVPATGVVEVKFTFKEGGAFDFHTQYERVRERLQQAIEVSRIQGDGPSSAAGGMNNVDVSNVNLDDLPAYQEQSDGPLMPPTAMAAAAAQQRTSRTVQPQRDSGIAVQDERPRPKPTDNTYAAPNEPPPGYEETQMAGLQDEMDKRATKDRK